jgi:hypothetical protein
MLVAVATLRQRHVNAVEHHRRVGQSGRCRIYSESGRKGGRAYGAKRSSLNSRFSKLTKSSLNPKSSANAARETLAAVDRTMYCGQC